MWIAGLGLVLGLLAMTAARAEVDDSRERYNRLMAQSLAMNLQQFAEAGLPSLANRPAGEGRQFVFNDPYYMLAPVTLELAHMKDGGVAMKVSLAGRVLETTELPSSVWSDLVTREKGIDHLFFRNTYETWAEATRRMAGQAPPPMPGICHGWVVRVAAFDDQELVFGGVGECGGGEARLDYGATLARLAVSARPFCVFDPKSPFWSVRNCYAPPKPN